MSAKRIRVLVVDDSATVRQSLKEILESDPDIEVMATAGDPFIAVERIKDSPLTEVVVTNSIPLSDEARASGKFKVVSVARLLAEAIRRIHHSDSVSSLFV